MKRLALVFFILVSTQSVFAVTEAIDMKMELYLDGVKVSSPRIVALEGHRAMVSQKSEEKAEETFIEVIATTDSEKTKDGIFMKFVVGYIKDGNRKIVSRPQILARPGEKAEIVVADDKLNETLRLNVIATRAQQPDVK